jgi:hypothetical protein
VKWINGSERKWACEHVNKCVVWISQDGCCFQYSTDWPEPEGEYEYFFHSDLYGSGRAPIPCDCKKEVKCMPKENIDEYTE